MEKGNSEKEREREQCFIWELGKTMFYMGIRKNNVLYGN